MMLLKGLALLFVLFPERSSQVKQEEAYIGHCLGPGVPVIPNVFVEGKEDSYSSPLLSIWRNRLKRLEESPCIGQEFIPQPKTIIVITPSKMINLVPQDAPNPLYAKGYEKLTDEFILDYISPDTINVNGPAVRSPQGVKIKTSSGKYLIFKKNSQTGKLYINGIEVEKYQTIGEDVNVFTLKNFLFNHYNDVRSAFNELVRTRGASTFGKLESSNLKTDKISTESFDVPDVPASLKSQNLNVDASSLINLWEDRLYNRKKYEPALRNVGLEPKTILAVIPSKMIKLIPQDGPNPFYAKGYEKFTDEFILDHLSPDTVNINDFALRSPEGLKIKTNNGKYLIFRKESLSGKLSVNGINIEKYQKLSNGASVFIISDFLFDHYQSVQNASNDVLRERREIIDLLDDSFNKPATTDTTRFVVPNIPRTLKYQNFNPDAKEFIKIWEDRLYNRKMYTPLQEGVGKEPKTILAVTPSKMNKLFLQDQPNPLYTKGKEHFTDEFILDYLSSETVNMDDTALRSSEGVMIKTNSGKYLIFKRDSVTGKLSVNGVYVEKYQTLRNEVTIFILSDFLFNHYEYIHNASDELFRTKGATFSASEYRRKPESIITQTFAVPNVPASLKLGNLNVDPSGLLTLWEDRIFKRNKYTPFHEREAGVDPKTIIAVTPLKMMKLAQKLPNPLYEMGYEKFTDEFISDYLSPETFDMNDPALLSPEGIMIKSNSGKYFLFKKDPFTGKLSVNGVYVEKYQTLRDGVNVFIIGDFLFDYYQYIQDVINEMLRERREPTEKLDDRTKHGTTTAERFVVPDVPSSLKYQVLNVDASGLVGLWKDRLYNRNIYSPSQRTADGIEPKTILAVTPEKMTKLVPEGAPNPLYAKGYEHFTDEFILDYLSPDTVDMNDSALRSPEGVMIKTGSGKYLIFKKDPITEKLFVNGVYVEKYQKLEDGVTVFVLSDFLFNHYENVHNASDELLRTRGATFSTSEYRRRPESISTPEFVVPNVPESLKHQNLNVDPSGLLNLWKDRLYHRNKYAPMQSRDSGIVPKTIIAITPVKMMTLIKHDAPNPLYAKDYEKFTDEFILDYLSPEEINIYDPALRSRSGVNIKTITGKSLILKKDPLTGKLSVNGVYVDKYQKLRDGTTILVISDFLFNHYEDVHTASDELLRKRGQTFKKFEHGKRPEKPATHTLALPKVPDSLRVQNLNIDPSEFVAIWEDRLFKRSKYTRSEEKYAAAPKTILAVTSSKMKKLVPEGLPNPLYSIGYENYTDKFILDHLSPETFDMNAPALSTPEGVAIKSSSGNYLIFKRDSVSGKLKVNGVYVESYETLSDGVNVFIISDFIFDHYQYVQDAINEMLRKRRETIGKLDDRTKSETSIVESFVVPNIPASLKNQDLNVDASGLLNLWEDRLYNRKMYSPSQRTAVGTEPKTILAVTPKKMTNIYRKDAPNPFYSKGNEKFTDDFILDYLSPETVNLYDPALRSPAGIKIKTNSGKYLFFKKDPITGKLSVNGVYVEKYQTLGDGVTVLILSNFLYNHYENIHIATDELLRTRGENFEAYQYRKRPETTPTLKLVVPNVPTSLKSHNVNVYLGGFVNIWEDRLKMINKYTPFHKRDAGVEPETIIAVTPSKKANLIPQDAPNPFYTKGYEQLTDEFILDYLSPDAINLNDPTLRSLKGVMIKTSSGKYLVFKKNINTGKLYINGVEVEKYKTLEDGSNLFIIKDFLFNHFENVRTAINEILHARGDTFEKLDVHQKPETFNIARMVVPNVPAALKSHDLGVDISSLTNIWENRIIMQNKYTPFHERNVEVELKTIIAVTPSKMINLIPQYSSNPLYAKGYEQLANEFILDHLSSEAINIIDPALRSPEGVMIKTISGKYLTFKKNFNTGKLYVNGVEVEKYQPLENGVNIFIAKNFLFNHYNDVRSAFNVLLRTRDISTLEKLEETQKSGSPIFRSMVVPSVPSVLKLRNLNVDASGLVTLWEDRLYNRKMYSPLQDKYVGIEPKTILAVAPAKMAKLIPEGAPNPLYAKGYEQFTDEFILDYLSPDSVNMNDPTLRSPEGVMIKTSSGKYLIFKRDPITGKMSVNGVYVEKYQTLGETTVFILSDFLFNHYDDAKKASDELLRIRGASFADSQYRKKPETTATVVPSVPETLKLPNLNIDVSGLLNLWEDRLYNRKMYSPLEVRDIGIEPKTILVITPAKMTKLIKEDAPNPFYSKGYEKFTDEFILDYLSTETININIPAIRSDEGITIKTSSGKYLTFKKDFITGKLSVNGVYVEKYQTLDDGVTVVVLSDFLFNHYDDVLKASDELLRTRGQTFRTFEYRKRSESTIKSNLAVPNVPESLKDSNLNDASGFVSLWEDRLYNINKYTPLQERDVGIKPRTILAVTLSKMNKLVPSDAPNPLYAKGYEEFTDEFILDYLSPETFDMNDPKLTSLEGVKIKTNSGKYLIFKKNPSNGKLSVNGVYIDKYETLKDGVNFFIISDFLFDHYEDVQNASNELRRARREIFGNLEYGHRPQSTTTPKFVLPSVPETLKSQTLYIDASSLVNIWEDRLYKRNMQTPLKDRGHGVDPKTILVVTPSKLVKLIPQEAPNPLYAEGFEKLTDEFVLDHLSPETLNMIDPALRTPEGVKIKTNSGKYLIFKRDTTTGKLSVNNVYVENYQILNDGITVFIISDFLFNHYEEIKNAAGVPLQPRGQLFGKVFHQAPGSSLIQRSIFPNVPASFKLKTLQERPSF